MSRQNVGVLFLETLGNIALNQLAMIVEHFARDASDELPNWFLVSHAM